jgi:hypothetical protein
MLAGTLAFSLAPPTAEAASPPRGVQGRECGPLARSVGAKNIWRAYFHGAQQGPFDHVWWYTSSPCFRSQADCKAWLSGVQSEWPYYMDFRPCHRGLS